MKSQLPELSALLDGELDSHEVRPLVQSVAHERGLREAWQAYTLIGDQLRQDCPGAADVTASVMARLRSEPVVLAPRQLPRPGRHQPLLALVASVAGVAVVGWLALTGNPQSAPANAVLPAPTFSPLASPAGGTAIPVAPVSASAATRGDMSEYLLAHHTQASTFRLGDNTEHVRTVSMTHLPSRP
jgi:sigma-E factor negative regulatory protein RseA